MDKLGREEAWRLARQMRCCPPAGIVHGELTKELRAHLEICPTCVAIRRENSLADIPILAGKQTRQAQVAPGELRAVSELLSGWGPKKRYYNAPVVLITDIIDERSVHVVQTFGDTIFRGPGDILLDNGLQGFAQPWNRYTLQAKHLAVNLGRISPACLAAVIKNFSVDHCVGNTIEQGSLLWFFRQMEVETGWFIAHHSISPLLDLPETPPEQVSPIDKLAGNLRQLGLIVPDGFKGEDPEDLLAMVRLPDDRLPLAAADQSESKIQILLFEESETIDKIREISGAILQETITDTQWRISGTVDRPVTGHWIFRLQIGDRLIKPLPGQYGAEENVFWVTFPAHDLSTNQQGELLVRIIRSS